MADTSKESESREGSNNNVRVCIRVRPMLPRERIEKSATCVCVNETTNQVVIGETRSFTFDDACPPTCQQREIYTSKGVSKLVDRCFEGFNATILAYGQTGSGKTYTMGMGGRDDTGLEEEGIVPRVLRDVFERVRNANAKSDVSVRLSFLEIYRETVHDLLRPRVISNRERRKITIREGAKKGIVVVGAREVVVKSYEEAMSYLEEGLVQRTTGCTKMNDTSSRSHAILTLSIVQRIVVADSETKEEEKRRLTAKFHLVDLAGSERAKRTGASGVAFKESVNINRGLLALGKVINALGDTQRKRRVRHVPYRDSKLTRLLQDSLGGNAHTLMIACVSPSDTSFEETLNTLKYANRARNIRNKAIVNRNVETRVLVVPGDDEESKDNVEDDVCKLKEELDAAREDLRRDEIIFQRKEEERARLHNQLNDALEANRKLREALDHQDRTDRSTSVYPNASSTLRGSATIKSTMPGFKSATGWQWREDTQQTNDLDDEVRYGDEHDDTSFTMIADVVGEVRPSTAPGGTKAPMTPQKVPTFLERRRPHTSHVPETKDLLERTVGLLCRQDEIRSSIAHAQISKDIASERRSRYIESLRKIRTSSSSKHDVEEEEEEEDDDVIMELQHKIDAADAEIEYNTVAIDRARSKLQQLDMRTIQDLVNSLPDEEARACAVVCAREVLELRKSMTESSQKMLEMTSELEQERMRCRQLKAALDRRDLSFQRRLETATRQACETIARKSDAYREECDRLKKDNMFYRQTHRVMKRKIRLLAAAAKQNMKPSLSPREEDRKVVDS